MRDAWNRRLFCGGGVLAVFLATTGVAVERTIDVRTSDGVAITATFVAPEDPNEPRPAVVFIHQGGSSRSEWTGTRLFSRVVDEGWMAVAYDVRGHGDSGGVADFDTLFDDPEQAPLDLRAVLSWLKMRPDVDSRRIAVVGASIGANLACVAAGRRDYSIKTAVAISAKVPAVFNLAGGRNEIDGFQSVFHIASGLEQAGMRAEWAKEMFMMTEEPRRLEILEDSSGHGVSIFDDDPSVQARIFAWLTETI